jgi:hypothetical protein
VTLDPKKREHLSRGDAKFREIIEKYGWHVMSVAPRTGSADKEEWFSYSTGLYLRFRQPEMIVLGLDSDTGARILNEIGEQMKRGRTFELGTDYHDIFANDVPCQFKPVHRTQYREYVCFSTWFYETTDFPVWQCLWPDRNGIYPWLQGCNQEVAQLQPLLSVPSNSQPGAAM